MPIKTSSAGGPVQKKKKNRSDRAVSILKAAMIIISLLVIIAAISAFLLVQNIRHYANTPVTQNNVARKVVTIPPGSNYDKVTAILAKNRIIQNPWKFKLLGILTNAATQIKAGEYELDGSMTPREIIDILTSGRVCLYKVTIPEGFEMARIAKRLEKTGLCKARDFLAAATDKGLLSSLGLAADSAEGYLFPDTYSFPKDYGARNITKAMIKRFWIFFSSDKKNRARKLGKSIHEIVTIASIIEKETAIDSERPVIASVIYNRLQRNMRLECDPTVIYGIHDFNGNLTRADLKRPGPYNTYLLKGLPPGPICSPGASSLDAALYPAKTDYLYFVATKKGGHVFSKTLSEHNRAVRRYQLKKK